MKYIYIVDSRNPYQSHIEEAESKRGVYKYAGDKILELMGDMAVLNAVYEILIGFGELKPGDILAPERNVTD